MSNTDSAPPNLLADLAALRSLAEDGRGNDPKSAYFSLWWGTLATLALVTHGAIIAGMTPFGQNALGALWFGFGIFGALGSGVLGALVRRAASAPPSLATRITAAMWNATTVAIFVFAIALVVRVFVSRDARANGGPLAADMLLFDVIPPLAFTCYALAYSVAAQLTRNHAETLRALAALGFVAACTVLIGSAMLYLVAAIGVASLAVAPSLVGLLRGRRGA